MKRKLINFKYFLWGIPVGIVGWLVFCFIYVSNTDQALPVVAKYNDLEISKVTAELSAKGPYGDLIMKGMGSAGMVSIQTPDNCYFNLVYNTELKLDNVSWEITGSCGSDIRISDGRFVYIDYKNYMILEDKDCDGVMEARKSPRAKEMEAK